MGHHQHDVAFRFCPVCGEALESRSLRPGEPERQICPGCRFVVYLDPKVVACTLVEDRGRVLLLRRAMEPMKGKWVLPGGYVDRGEPLEEAAKREVREECSLTLGALEFLGAYSYKGAVPVVLVYIARGAQGDLVIGEEAEGFGWFPAQDIPWDDLAFPSTRDALRDHLGRMGRVENT